MRLILVLVIILISGCIVPSGEIEYARDACKDRGGLSEFRLGMGFKMYSVVCKDGTKLTDYPKGE
jgi:hypothetical protein